MMSKKFDEWNEVKQKVEKKEKISIPKEREVYWASIGENIGFEQNGKSELFTRPVLVLKRFTKNMFFGIPLFYDFELDGEKSNALLVQARLYDTKRLEKKIGMISKEDFQNLKKKFGELIDV